MTFRTLLTTTALCFSLFAVSSCGESGPTITSLEPEATDTPAMKQAKEKFKLLCHTCHGMSGKGDGLAGQALNPKPRDYQDKAWQASVTDDYLANVILKGGGAVGKSPLMPPNPDLAGKPEVVDALVEIVRWFGTLGGA